MNNHPLNRLKHHVTGAIERCEKEAIVETPAKRQSLALGTILATEAQMARFDRFADKQAMERERKADKLLAAFDKRKVDGEVRYYDCANRYAVMNRNGRVCWFNRKGEHWYAA